MGLRGIARLPAWLLFLAVLMVAVSLGCRPGKDSRERKLKLEADQARSTLEDRVKEKRDPHGRAKIALTKLNDSVRVDGPFLISVNLGCRDDNEPVLFFACLDEGRNLRGICVREERTDPNGRTMALEERYPVYVAWPETNILANHTFSVAIRNGGQRKDEAAWNDYVISVQEDVIHKFVYDGPVDETIKVPPNEALERTRPPIWISLPEPNRVRVSLSIYDREGRESDSVDVAVSPRVYRVLKGGG